MSVEIDFLLQSYMMNAETKRKRGDIVGLTWGLSVRTRPRYLQKWWVEFQQMNFDDDSKR